MKNNVGITLTAKAHLLAEARRLCRQGQSGSFRVYLKFYSECYIPDDYGYVTGYHFLFGSNPDEGNYQITGWATVGPAGAACCKVKFDVTHSFNDKIDPNPQYASDTWFSWLAKVLTLASPDDYPIHIYWTETAEYEVAGSKEKLSGWPLTGISSPPTTPSPIGRR